MSFQPPTNLNGDYRDSCIICRRCTDTGVGTMGEVAWHAAFLVGLGADEDRAIEVVTLKNAAAFGGRFKIYWRLCSECVERVNPNFPRPVALMNGAALPVVTQP